MNPDNEDFAAVLREINTSLPMRMIARRLDQIDMSADAKALLMDMATVTVKIGTTIVYLGRKLISFAFELMKMFPNTLFGIIIALVVSMLIGSVPIIGAALADLFGPLVLAFGLGIGALQDMGSLGMKTRIRELEMQFSVLQARA